MWRRFVEFESQIGDLPSINKVEKRRLAVHQSFKDFEGKESSLLVERYQYLDLFPCSVQELRCLGYKVSTYLDYEVDELLVRSPGQIKADW